MYHQIHTHLCIRHGVQTSVKARNNSEKARNYSEKARGNTMKARSKVKKGKYTKPQQRRFLKMGPECELGPLYRTSTLQKWGFSTRAFKVPRIYTQ